MERQRSLEPRRLGTRDFRVYGVSFRVSGPWWKRVFLELLAILGASTLAFGIE